MADFNEAFADEEAILSRYKDLEWIGDVRGFDCTRCGRVLIRHYISNCEHKFCFNFHKLLGDGSERWRCPLCQEFITTIDRQDVEFRDRVYHLQVHCPNQKYGCDHTCPLKELKCHMDVCEYTRESALPVPYEGHMSPEMLDELLGLRTEVKEMRQMMTQLEQKCNDRESERKKVSADINSRMDEMQSKLRVDSAKINAENSDLKTEDKISLVVVENKTKILKLDVKCDLLMNMLEMKEKNLQSELQNVKKQMENQDENIKTMQQSIQVMETELNNTKTTVEENAKKLKGNTKKFVMKQMEQVTQVMSDHIMKVNEKMDENVSELHLKLETIEERVETLKTEKNKIVEDPTQLSCFNLSQHNDSFLPDFRWKISGIKDKLEGEEETFEIESEVFEWAAYPVQSRAKLEVKDDGQVHVSLCLEAQAAMDLKLIPQVYYVLRDQTTTLNPKHINRTLSYLFTAKFDHSLDFDTPIALKSHLPLTTYNVDDSVLIDIHVEPPTMAHSVLSRDGNLSSYLDHYHRRKQMEKEGLVPYQESPYFYTAPNGYRVQVRLWLDGCGEYRGKGLTAEVLFWTGAFDDELALTFPHRTTITLFNPKDSRQDITKTTENDIANGHNYAIDVCSEREMDSVVEDDTLFYKVNIKTIEKKKSFFFF